VGQSFAPKSIQTLVSFVSDHPLSQQTGSASSEPAGPPAVSPADVPYSTFQRATLRTERIRIIGLISVIFFMLVVLSIRGLLGGLPEQLQLLPPFSALLLAAAAYECLMLRIVRRAIQHDRDLRLLARSVNAFVEALIPTTTLFLLTESKFMGPYRALSAPAIHAYYVFIILSILQLRPALCFLTGLASALGFAAVTVYTLVVYPSGRGPETPVYPLQVYITFGIFMVICGTIAAWLSAQFRRHVMAALREAEIRGQYEWLVREITQRERAELALRASERRYRQLTEQTRDAIVLADQAGTITLFNPAAQVMFGYSEPEVRGQPLTILMPQELRQAHSRGFQRYLETRVPHLIGRAVEVRGRRKTGEVFPVEISLSAVDLPEGIGFLGAIRDLTERQRMQGQIVQAEKLASLGLLSAGVAHEINNPLSYVTNNLAVLERHVSCLGEVLAAYEQARSILETASPERADCIAKLTIENDLPYIQEHVGAILKSTRQGVKRVSDIVQNLRGFARLDQAAIDRLDLNAAIASSLELIRSRLDRHRIDVVQNLGTIPAILCAPAQINQVILNLLLNAAQAIEASGRTSGRIEISTRTSGQDVILDISDDGCGIPPEIQPRIFDPFFTTKPVGEGTGLGLSSSHGIVSDHGGRIELKSALGQGTRFRVVLPVEGKQI
jgi:PAS domain S-box-containing protein